MSHVRAFYLRFLSPVRVGVAAGSAHVARDFPSDTLSAALLVAAAELGGERIPPPELAALAREPPWIVSSLLPWVGLGGRPVRFVPRPVDRRLGGGAGASAYRHVAYVSTELLGDATGAPAVSRCGTLAATAREAGDELGRIVWQRRLTRAARTHDRVTGATSARWLEELSLGAGAMSGAWVAVRTEAEEEMKFVRVLLGYLADSGLGADRARGLGRFELVQDLPLSVDEMDDPDRMRLLLGYASPDPWLEEALLDPRARYAVLRRDGVAHGVHGGAGVARRGLRLLAPGSVIPDGGLVVGRTRDVTPDGFDAHPIVRDGRTLAFPLPARRPS